MVVKVVAVINQSIVVSLLIGCATAGSHAGSNVFFSYTTSGVVGVSVLPSDTLRIGLSIPSDIVMADHEKFPREMSGWIEVSVTVFCYGLGGAF
jgi:hypothetical protein